LPGIYANRWAVRFESREGRRWAGCADELWGCRCVPVPERGQLTRDGGGGAGVRRERGARELPSRRTSAPSWAECVRRTWSRPMVGTSAYSPAY